MEHHDVMYERHSRIPAHAKEMEDRGFVSVPYELREFFGKKEWIHTDTLKLMRSWLSSCPYCKLTEDSN